MAVRVDLNVSLDGFVTTTDQTVEDPMGSDWSRLVSAYVAARTFRERVLHDTSGEGTTGIDDDWWGDEPPFHFLSATPAEVIDRALEAADGRDVRVGGGPTVVREFVKVGLVDQLHVAIALWQWNRPVVVTSCRQ